ncbi:MAG: hypothetical protein HYV07_15805 [Deltaproteobacteria bacterium]|nr:hypothetical protein [Deltaproteobacteria bacterium]
MQTIQILAAGTVGLLLTAPVHADETMGAEDRPVVGLVIGAPTGVTASWTVSGRFVVSVGVGLSAGDQTPMGTFDVCYRLPEALGGSALPFVLYVGVGTQLNGKPLAPGATRPADLVAARVPVGVEALGAPITALGLMGRTRVFVEIAPGIGLVDENRAVLSAAFGLRL